MGYEDETKGGWQTDDMKDVFDDADPVDTQPWDESKSDVSGLLDAVQPDTGDWDPSTFDPEGAAGPAADWTEDAKSDYADDEVKADY